MPYVTRKSGTTLQEASRHFPAVVITGPRRAGKATLLRQLFPKARYVLLEDPDIQGRIRDDPRTLIDSAPRRMGQWLFTGSQEAPLMLGFTESMAGRAAILQLLPFSLTESG